MTDEKSNTPRMQSNASLYPDPVLIREQAKQKAKSMPLPDLDTMTHEEIQQQFHEMQVRQIEARLENEQLRSGFEEKDDTATLFSIVTENMLDMVALTDMEGNFTFAGKSHEVLGYEPGFLIGKNVMDFVHPEDLPRTLDEFGEFVASGHPRKVEYRYRCSDGNYLWLETGGNFFGDESGSPQAIVFSSRDITERKQAKEALRKSEEKFRHLFERAEEGILIVRGETIEFANPALEDILGYPIERITLEPFFSFVHPDDLETIQDLHLRLMQEEFLEKRHDFRIVASDGRVKWITIHGQIIEWDGAPANLSFVTEITERKRAEKALRENRDLLDTTQRLAKIGGWEWDVCGQTMSWTDEAYHIHGFEPGEVAAGSREHIQRSLACYDPDDRQVIEAAFRRCAEEGKPYDLEVPFTTVHGQRKWVKTIAQAVMEENRIIKVIGNIMDITERKQVEEALRESEATIRKKIHAILEPDGDIETLNLADIIDSNKLQTMMEDFYKITQIGGAILDISGKVLFGVGWTDICAKFHRVHPHTAKNCLESDLALASGVSAGTLKAYRCKNNMWDMVSPIEIGGKHLGNIYIGQFFYDDEHVDYELFKKQAQQHGFDEMEYIAALDRVPRLKRETVNSAMTFYAKLTEMISSLSYSKIKLSRDISERKRVEELLRTSEKKYRSILEEIEDGYFEVDRAGNFTFFNDSMCRILGYSSNELMGMNNKAFMDSENADKVYRGFNQVFTSEKPIKAFDWKLIKKDGKKCYVDTSVSLIKNDNGEAIGFRGIARDVTLRKQVEAQLQLQSLLLNQIQDRVTMTDLNGVITYVNDAEARGLGCSRDELIGTSTEKYGEDPEQGATQREIIKKTLKHGSWRGEVVNKTVEGKEVILDCRTQVVLDEQGNKAALAGIATDITERKRAEEELKRRELTLNKIFDVLPIGLWFADKNGKLIKGNPAGVKIWGAEPTVPMEEYGVFKARRLPSGEEIAPNDWALVHTITNGTTITDELLEIDAFDGRKKIILNYTAPVMDDTGGMLGAIVVNNNITARWRAEEKLQESEEKYRMLVENLNEVIYALDEKGRFTYISPSIESVTGYTPSELIGKHYLDFVHPDDKKGLHQNFQRSSRGIDDPVEYRLIIKDNRIVWVSTAARPLLMEGRVTGVQGVLTDITEKKQAEKEKEKLQAQLNQAQKMESVGRLAGGVAHDFNNKLTIINGYAEMAIDMMDPSDPLHETIQEIHTAGEQSAAIVRQLLAFARKQTISPVQLDLNDIVSSMLKMLQRLIGENIDLAWHPGKNLWTVNIDPSQVDQIMANLAVNARDAIADVGKITIETENIEFDDEYCKMHAGFLPGQYVMLAVSDNGCGMDKHVLDNLFEPFFTTKEIGQGTGLGMPTVYGIAKQNNGFVNVYSEPRQGTTVKIYLPRLEAEETSLKPETKFKGQVLKGTETILIVEDEKGVLQMSRRILDRLGYTLLIAENPREALQLAEEYNETIHLLITDVVMPEMNGRELSSQMTMIRPGLKTLYMSGYTANAIAHNGVMDEDVLFIQKPFSLQDLAVKVREAIEQG